MEFKVTHFRGKGMAYQKVRRPIWILVGFLFVIGSLDSIAQRFDAGLRVAGSLNNSYGLGTDRYYSTPVFGASAGLYGTYLVQHNTWARLEALISTRGFSGQVDTYNSSTTLSSTTLSANKSVLTYNGYNSSSLKKQAIYLDVPFGIDYQIFPRITLQAGGMISLFLQEYKNELSSKSSLNSQAPKDLAYYQNLQGAIYIGAGYQFDFGLTAGVRGTAGLGSTFLASSSHSDGQIIPYSAQIFASYSLFRLTSLIKTKLL